MQLIKYLTSFLLVWLTLSIPIVHAAPPVTYDSVPQAKDKCPVCGMFVSKYPDWVVSVTFRNSSPLFFDGAKDFFTWYHNPQKYNPLKNKAAIALITVNDYYTLKPLDARQAHFILGSDVYGPMGKELVPFGSLSDAQTFLKDHRGKMILRFTDVSPATLKSLE